MLAADAWRNLPQGEVETSAPRPPLHDQLHRLGGPGQLGLLDLAPAFDAASILPMRRDIFYLHSDRALRSGSG